MKTKMSPVPDGFGLLEECPHVILQWTAIPRCNICGYISKPQFGCIPRMEKHLAEAHGIKPTEGKAWWIDCGEPGERM